MHFQSYKITMSDAGTVHLPAEAVRAYGPNVVLLKGLADCLMLYPEGLFNSRLGSLMSDVDQSLRNLKRLIAGGAYAAELDSTGYLEIPGDLASFAELDSGLALLCVGKHARLMSASRWSELRGAVEAGGGSVEVDRAPGDPLTWLVPDVEAPGVLALVRHALAGLTGQPEDPGRLLDVLGVIGPTEDGSVEVLVAARDATQSAGIAWSISRVPVKLTSLQDAAS
ncbi:MAG: hypothetical protein JXA36_08365 [Coriobacteriia bacterium]|nr:hypothetical protein [Coriobacteriia bacterium]